MKLKNRLAVSCASLLCLFALNGALASDDPTDPPIARVRFPPGKPSPEMMKEMLKNPWAVELGDHRDLGFPTKEACEAAIRTRGGDGHCVHMEWSTGRIIGSQDPAWSGSDQWVIEFNAVDGKYRRVGVGFPSKEACESAIPFQVREQGGGYNGHCIEFKDGHYVGSHDPAWAGK